MPYIPHSDIETKQMLAKIGVKSYEELFATIPEKLRASSFDINTGLSEQDVCASMHALSKKNIITNSSFVGGGYYDHYIPAAVDAISSLPEFYTAYTPYQPEASQGWLQSIFEYQSAMCELTGMDVSNASMYDGTTALAEAAMMAIRSNGRNKIVVSGAVNFLYYNVLETYSKQVEFELIKSNEIDENTSALIIQNPDFYGQVHDYTKTIEAAHSKGVIVIMVVYPISLGMLKTPAQMGADIVVAEGQCLGNPLAFGGPYLGVLCTSKKLSRKMPGRIVGQAQDSDGKRGYVLTLQAREQHIRRHKATSNICSNQALCALRALVYLTVHGSKGLKGLAEVIYDRTDYMRKKLRAVSKLKISDHPVFNEFVVTLPYDASELFDKMLKQGIMSGLPLGIIDKEHTNKLLVSVTEKNTVEDIDRFVKIIQEVL